MAGVKEMSGTPAPAQTQVQPPAPGSVPMSASDTAAAGRAARKSAELQAGQVMIAQAAKQAAEAKEELERERAERKSEHEQEDVQEKRDTSELSRQSKWFGIDGKLLESGDIKWVLEMEQELLEALLKWMPSGDTDISKQLDELSRLYLALLESILIHTMGDEQAAQIARLDEILAQKLSLLLDTDLNELMDFLKQTGQTETIQDIQSSVYKQTTGTSISSRAASQFYAKGKAGAAGNTRYFMPESSGSGQSGRAGGSGSTRSFSLSGSDEGTLYKLAKGRNIQINQAFDASRKSGELQISQRTRALSGSGSANASIAGGKSTFTGNELARANRFAAHINGSGSLLNNPGITARNEEVIGYLAAITSIKGEMYAVTSGRQNAMNIPIRSAVNQMVDFYLNQKGIYKVYDYTTNVYERTNSAQRALEEGLEYAYALFQEKKADMGLRQQAEYQEQAGFFQMLLKNQSLEGELLKGMRLLEDNWREFLRSIGEDEKKGISLKMQKHSPWGALLEPGEQRRFFRGKASEFILKEAFTVAVLLAIYLCYRFLIG